MKRILFIDRDGTIIREPADEQIDSFDKLRFVSGVIRNLAFLREKLPFCNGLQSGRPRYSGFP